MLTIGIDPGLNTTGYGLLEPKPRGKPRLLEAGVVRSPSSQKEPDLGLRLKCLSDGLCEILDEYKPTAMAVEQLYAHYAHPRTAIIMGHARGVLLLAAGVRGIPVFHYAATRVKKTVTGHGRASKEQVQLTVMRELGLLRAPEPHDVTDALAIALCHCAARPFPEETPLRRAV